MDDYNNWRGRTVLDKDGNKIGTLSELYVDDDTNRPKFATVQTGLFGTKQNFFPVPLASVRDEDIVLDTTEDHVKNAPQVDVDEILEGDQERLLYEYYGLTWDDDGAADADDRTADYDEDDEIVDEPVGAVGHDTSGPTTDEAMTRSEERLNVGTEQVESGRVRLKKYIVTENVTTTVPVSREEVRVEREDITDENRDSAMAGPDLSSEEHEIVLNEERPVIDKETVPVERVRLDKEVVTGEAEVDEDVRKEKIDIEGDGERSDMRQ